MTEYFALNNLDRQLEAYLGYKGGFFVEAGANDGVNQSNTLFFERHRSWRGVLVEPSPGNAHKCRTNRANETKVYCAACVPFSYKEPTVPMIYSNLMTTSVIPGGDILDPYAHAQIGSQFLSPQEEVASFSAEARTLNDILIDAQAPHIIDLLSLDAEGLEIPILEGVDHDRFRFKFLVVEARVFQRMEEYLQKHGYSFIRQLSEHDYLFGDNRNSKSLKEPGLVQAQIPAPYAPPKLAKVTSYRAVFLNTCYEAFIRHHYRMSPELVALSYQEQLLRLNQTFFGDSDFYSRGLSASGFEALDLVVNCAPLQEAWAKQYGYSTRGWELVRDQLDFLDPDLVYVQDMAGTPRELLSYLQAKGVMIVGQIACELAHSVPLDLYDVVFSSFLHYVEAFRNAGITSFYQPLAYEPQVLGHIPQLPFNQRDIELSFIGGISGFHQAGTQLLELLARETPLQIWGYGAEQAPPNSSIARKHRGEAWGLEMFSLFGRSRITINRHSEAASVNANNMRLFEATGCGALLITDYKDNLNQLFEIGKEVVAYRSPDECVALTKYYLRHPGKAEEIAAAGQRRTLSEHSYDSRMVKTAEYLSRRLDYRRLELPVPNLNSISAAFKPIVNGVVKSELATGWKDKGIAEAQRGLVQNELSNLYRGVIPEPFEIAARLLKPITKRGSRVLEVGCSSGYYYEVLEYLLKKPLEYTGIDYSEAMIEMARRFYPQARFEVADGAALPFKDQEFEIVISGCVLLHCPNYLAHVKDTCRVARSYILLHRTPISTSGETRFFEKLAYGVPTVELWFSESELMELFSKGGFKCVERIEYSPDPARELTNVSYLMRSKAGL